MDKNKIAVNVFNKLARLYQDKFMDVNMYCDSLNYFCDNILKKGADILEIACGPGNITKYLLSKRPDFKILGTDLAPNMIDLARKNNPTAEFQLFDCRDIGMISKKYDAIMCGFCLPYLSKEESEKLITEASKLLLPEGLLYLSTMEDDYSKSGFKKGSTRDEIFMYFHQADYLTRAIEDSDLNIKRIERKEYPGQDGSITKDLIIISVK